MRAETKINNRLWQARHRAGLEQKQVARLLGHKNCDQISRYERGSRKPGIQIALKLELIYGTPVSELFPEHYQQFRAEIAAATSSGGGMSAQDEREGSGCRTRMSAPTGICCCKKSRVTPALMPPANTRSN